MEVNLTVKDGSHFKYLDRDQVEEILANFAVKLPAGQKIVTFSQKEPQDICNYWQPTNGCGDPIGKVRKFDTTLQEWIDA